MKKRIRLTEAQLHNVIRRCINEAMGDNQELNYQEIAEQLSNEIQEILDKYDTNAWTQVVIGYDNSPEIDVTYSYITSSYADGPGIDESKKVISAFPEIEKIIGSKIDRHPKVYYHGDGDYSYENSKSYVWTIYPMLESYAARTDKH